MTGVAAAADALSQLAGVLAAITPLTVAALPHKQLAVCELQESQASIAVMPLAASGFCPLKFHRVAFLAVIADPEQRIHLPVT